MQNPKSEGNPKEIRIPNPEKAVWCKCCSQSQFDFRNSEFFRHLVPLGGIIRHSFDTRHRHLARPI
jgi:hypothetical protein